MTGFAAAHATGQGWADIAKACVESLRRQGAESDGANLGFLYVTDALADDLTSILTFLRQTLAIDDWVGTVGLGICAGRNEYHDQAAAAVLTGRFDADGFRVFPALRGGLGQMPAPIRDWAGEGAAPFAVVHGDPQNPRLPAILEEIAGALSSFLVGGLTASRKPASQIAGDLASGGISGVLFGPDVQVATGLSQGCAPVAEPHWVTETEDGVIMSIDGRPALEVMKEDIGELLARDLARAAGYIHAAFPVPGSDTRDYLVRSLVGIDPNRGWIAVGSRIETGDRMMFVRRDPTAAAADLTDMVDNLASRLPGPPRAGLYFSCVARGPNMFGGSGREMELIVDRLGDFPLVGFYGNGEISNARLYGYTGVLALFV